MKMKGVIFGVVLFTVCVASIVILTGGCSKRKEKASEKKVVLTFASVPHPLYDKIRNTQCENFEKSYPGVKVKFLPITGQGYFDKIMTMIGGGTAPDIFYMEEMLLPEFAKRGVLVDLNPYIEKDEEFNVHDFLPVVIEAYTYNEKLYGLSENFQALVMYYNKKMFDEAGILYPDKNLTWDSFLETAMKLTKRDEYGKVMQFGAAMPYSWDIIMRQNGGRVFNEDKSKCIINNHQAIEAIHFICDLYTKYHVIPRPKEQREQGIYELFAGMRAAMFIGYGGRWYTVPLREVKELKWGASHLPKGKYRAAPTASHAFVISSGCKYKEIAWEFLKDITGLEGQKYVIKTGDAVPTLKSLAKSEFFLYDPDFPDETNNQVHIEALNYAYLSDYPRQISFREMVEISGREIDLVYIGEKAAEDALKIIEQKTNKLIEESKSGQ